MEYLNIIEENFTKADYVAYLRGSMLKCLLEDKPFDTTEFKLYTDKLVEVLQQPADEKPVKIDVYRPVIESTEETSTEPTVDTDEPKVQPKTLKKDTWYHTKDFTLEELKELLPKGTTILVEKPVKQTPSTITMLQTPVGYVKIGDIVCYDRFNKQLRFGTVVGFEDSNLVKIHHAYTVKFGQDGKQTVYSMLNCSIENYRICDIL